MNLLEHLATWLVGWLTVAAICGLAWSVCVTRYKARQRADITRRAAYPPPVPRPTTPPFTQTEPSADWFWGIPADCLGDDAIRALADDIERREFS